MENLVFAVLMMGCDHSLEACAYVPTPMESYATREECEGALPLALHEAQKHPVALGDCVAVPGKWIESDIALEWTIDGNKRLNVAVVGPDNEIYGDMTATEVAADGARARPAG